MKNTVFITGATGNVGGATLESLLKNDSGELRILVGTRNMDRAKSELGEEEVEYRHFDFKDSNSIEGSLDDVDKMFLIRPPAISSVKKYILPIIKEAKKAGVNQMVFLSLQGVESNPIVPHYRIEKYIKEVGVPYTFLRPSFFMQNLTTSHKEEIRDRDELFVPAGEGETNFIDVRDIGAVAALTLVAPGHKGKAYELTGDETLTYSEVAKILSEVLGRKITYEKPSVFEFFISKKREGVKTSRTLVMIGLYTMARFGKAARTTNKVQELLDRKPISFTQFAKDFKEVWARK